MKIIHCADVHLDSRMMASMTREQVNTRRMDMLRTFMRTIEYADDSGVSVMLIAGNLFDARNISANIRNQVMDAIVSHPAIDFIYLQGNKKNDNFLSRVEEIPSNLLLFGEDWTSYTYGKITICGREADEKQISSADYCRNLVLKRDHFNIVLLQVQQEEGQWQMLCGRNIDYLAMGGENNYRFSQLDARGYFCYPGCLEGRSFSECDDHGFILLEVDENTLRPSYGFVPIASRRFYTVPVDISGRITTREAIEAIETALNNEKYTVNDLIRIILKGNLEINSSINEKEIESYFREKFFYAEVGDETELIVNAKDFEKDASLRGEFIRTVLMSGLDPEKKMEVIRIGAGLLAGEEI